MCSEVLEHLLGAKQCRSARDPGDCHQHNTTSPEALASFIISGHIEARNRFGLSRSFDRDPLPSCPQPPWVLERVQMERDVLTTEPASSTLPRVSGFSEAGRATLVKGLYGCVRPD